MSSHELVSIEGLALGDVELQNVTTKDVHHDRDATDDSNNSQSNEASNEDSTRMNRAMTFSPALPENTPTVLTFTNISVATKTKPVKILLNDISGSITGGFWAIMGASGGGKTTLLSTLSLRLDTNYMDITGEIRLNGREYSRQMLKTMSAYVMQDDLLHAELTVWETLSYAAQLRMGSSTTREQRTQRIEELLGLMGISHIKEVIIGNSRRKGVSGGERKRVSVSVELLNRPQLVFLDEPVHFTLF
jgi:ATP-binding cassette subfamily G (WHITE) protein 2